MLLLYLVLRLSWMLSTVQLAPGYLYQVQAWISAHTALELLHKGPRQCLIEKHFQAMVILYTDLCNP